MWDEVKKVSNISSSDTGISYINAKENLVTRKYDWSQLYGELQERRI